MSRISRNRQSPILPIYATVSDIVVYSPRGVTRTAIAVAEKFKQAVEIKLEERRARCPNPDALVVYNVFVLDASASEMAEKLPHLVVRTEDASSSGAHTDGTDAHTLGESDDTTRLLRATTIDFAQREKDEMRDLTQASEIVSFVDSESGPDPDVLAGSNTASHWEPSVGQIFLGNSNDVPLPPDRRIRMRTLRGDEDDEDTFDWRTNDPSNGYGYDLCIECHDYAPFPTSAHLRAAEEHLRVLEKRWIERCVAEADSVDPKDPLPPRPPPSASYVVHLPFPSSPASSVVTVNTLLPFISFLERLLQPLSGAPLTYDIATEQLSPSRSQHSYDGHSRRNTSAGFMPSSLPPPSSFPTSFYPSSPSTPGASYTRTRSTSATFLPATSPSTPVANGSASASPAPLRTRPVKILMYSADGYTESSVLALCILMAMRGISLPEAYLTLQVEKRRSFFVYQSDLGVLRRVEARLEKDRTAQSQHSATTSSSTALQRQVPIQGEGDSTSEAQSPQGWVRSLGRAAAKSVSFTAPAMDDPAHASAAVSALAAVHPTRTRSESEADAGMQTPTPGRPRAHTMPPSRVPPWRDHQAWFNDARFDGSFPSRVLPFLYLGNLNHASNAFMLHALGITHVVSVGECALVPPPHLDAANAAAGTMACSLPNSGAHFVPGKGPGGQGSLWIEEREGRIKVLDIKGVCDDGIDTLEPQLQPICDWIDKAREEGGKVLVHCRVGVSRSATVVIAYVMKHLSLPLVDAYLIVRSRRLSVLIQPNMRLLYNLLGWEVKLARDRTDAALSDDKCAGMSDQEKQEKRKTRLRCELARALNWPYLAKEVHALNEKYLH
ncbi:Dual specificity protein phosphatase PPS1 [Trametes pubescens]|uniref:Dual specificity protein phosphatase PPS1 n=1 Tax=Trametes pubescens TaxID=154538 RepID=A0A1M2W533_TRAPU|nr:Dual specificity protein phosphatase PPS1 [Trametes pubescens]